MSADLPYYDYGPLLSRNGTFNFVIGPRGNGKTYGAKKWAIKDFLKNGHQFTYLRRYETELKPAKATLFADIAHEFPGHLFRCHGETFQTKIDDESIKEWQTCGYAHALSRSQQIKSNAFPNVTKILYDEFLIESGHIRYLSNESKIFTDYFSTIDRYQDRTRAFFLANALTIHNPYFSAYDIQPTPNQEWQTSHGGFIICHYPKSAEFSGAVYKTKLGQFIEGTEYANYAVGANFADNHRAFIKRKHPEATYTLTLKTQWGKIHLWAHGTAPRNQPTWYLTRRGPKEQALYTLDAALMREGDTLLLPNDRLLQIVRTEYRAGRVRFDTPATRNTFGEVFKR